MCVYNYKEGIVPKIYIKNKVNIQHSFLDVVSLIFYNIEYRFEKKSSL